MKSKYTDTFFILLDARCKDKKIPDDDLYEALRKIDKIIEKEQSVQLSKKARDKYKIAKIEKGVARPKSVWLEHIIPVRERVKKMVDMYLWKGWKDREKIEKFIENTFYAVYKLTSEKDIEEYDAEELILEDFRTNEKIKYFNEYTPKR